MTTQVLATFINGMLHPDERLSLAEQTRVSITIDPLEVRHDPTEPWESLKAWIRANPIHGLGRHLTRDELHERG